MTTIKLTAKRQATFPAEVCKGLGVKPGDELELVPMLDENGERIWALKKAPNVPERQWLGCLKKYATDVEDHSMDAVRKSIQDGRKRDRT